MDHKIKGYFVLSKFPSILYFQIKPTDLILKIFGFQMGILLISNPILIINHGPFYLNKEWNLKRFKILFHFGFWSMLLNRTKFIMQGLVIA